MYQKVAVLITVILFGASCVFISSGRAEGLAERMKGRILLQVESLGQAWYVNPADNSRYYMGRPADAFGIMRRFGVGVTNADLARILVAGENYAGDDTDGDGLSDMFEDAIFTNKYSVDSDADGFSDKDEVLDGLNPLGPGVFETDNRFAGSQKGRILLAVEAHGEAWYVNPADGLRYFLGRPADAFGVMRGTGLGIADSDLAQIDAEIIEPAGANAEEAAAVSFVSDNLVDPGSGIVVREVSREGIYHKVVLGLSDGRTMTFYLAKDDSGKFEVKSTGTRGSADQDKPLVELFVMSHCPYGTQIEKGILPVLELLGDKINFELKFVYYAMHGRKETGEQLRQHCIRKNEPDSLTAYLGCFLEDGDSDRCLVETGIDSEVLADCVNTTDSEFSVTEKYNDTATWLNSRFPLFDVYRADNFAYGVSGSPTLVIDGKKMTSMRDPASLLATVCSAYSDPPEECSVELSTDVPSPGFGYGGVGTGDGGGCGG